MQAARARNAHHRTAGFCGFLAVIARRGWPADRCARIRSGPGEEPKHGTADNLEPSAARSLQQAPGLAEPLRDQELDLTAKLVQQPCRGWNNSLQVIMLVHARQIIWLVGSLVALVIALMAARTSVASREMLRMLTGEWPVTSGIGGLGVVFLSVAWRRLRSKRRNE